jgi:2-oxoglutarate ferredoxin oxidoreductase subunit delta
VVTAPGRYGGNEVSMAARGKVTIDVEECKGCGLCVDSCPPKCLVLAPDLSAYGVHPARYTGEGCTGCGICFYCCPEPGAITVYRLPAAKKAAPPPTTTQPGGSHAPAL